MENIILIVGLIVIAAFAYGIRFLVRKIMYTGTDALENAYKHRKNNKQRNSPENLADRYKR